MTERTSIRLIAEREIVEYARQPSYRNGTIITCVLIVLAVAAVSVLPRLLGGPDELQVAVLPAAASVAEALEAQAEAEQVEVAAVAYDDEEGALEALRAGEVEVVLLDGERIAVEQGADPGTVATLQRAQDAARLAELLGLPPGEALAQARRPIAIDVLAPADPQDAQRRWLTLVGVFLALSQVLGGAYVLANGLVEEKASRVVEVIVAKARPQALLAGKLVGLYLVLTAQLAAFFVVGLVAVALSPDLSLPSGLAPVVLAVLGWYTLAFVIFGALFSIPAALSSRQEDMMLKMQPMMYLVFAAFGGAFYAAAQPASLVSRIASFVPFTAPSVLPARQASGGVAAWEVALAVLVTLVAAAGAVALAGRAYAGGALRTRGTATLRATLTDGKG